MVDLSIFSGQSTQKFPDSNVRYFRLTFLSTLFTKYIHKKTLFGVLFQNKGFAIQLLAWQEKKGRISQSRCPMTIKFN